VPDSGEDVIIDFGLPLELPETGEGDPVLEKGLPRFCAGLDAMLL
jgi:hypothetical protein